MNLDQFSLSCFEVDCDGSACGSGRAVGLHVREPQDGGPALSRVVVRDGQRVCYEQARSR